VVQGKKGEEHMVGTS